LSEECLTKQQPGTKVASRYFIDAAAFKKRCEASLINAARCRFASGADGMVGIDEVFQDA
jgi:hypothetical protein